MKIFVDKFLLSVFLVVLFLDFLTKQLALAYLNLGEPVEIIEGLFNFTLVYNPGAAFGMFANFESPWRQITLGTVSLLALIVVFYLLKESKGDKLSETALSAVLAGAVGNLVDRFRFGYVVDFLDFYLGDYHWPAFNIADSSICIGVGLLLFRMLFPLSEDDNKAPSPLQDAKASDS